MSVKQDVAHLSREELEAEVVALRALAERIERNRRREAIFESAVDFAIVATDCHGIITDWNGAATRIMGWTAAEMIGNTADTFFTPEDRAQGRVATEMELALQNGSANDERWHLRKDGTRFWASGEMFALRDELNVHQGFVKILRDRTEQRDAGQKLLRSEERMRTVLEAVDTAFAIVEVKFDPEDRPVDYRFVEANPAFERQAGVNLRGKWVTEFAPDLERFWFETYGHVARTGEPANFENYAKAFGRWFDVRALRIGEPSARQIAIFFNDVTARRELEARNAATQQLSDSLRSLSDPDEIAETAARILGTTLRASVVGYGSVEPEEGLIVVTRDWTDDGIESLPKPIRVTKYGTYWGELIRGETVAIADVEQDPRTVPAAQELAAVGGRAFVNIPIMEHGRLIAVLYVGQVETRIWSQSEIVFLRDVANRIRIEIDRVQNERDLRASEARVQDYADRVKLALAAGAIIGTWVWDLREDKFTVDEAFANAFGLDPALGREGIPLAQIVATVHPDDQEGLAAAINEVISRGGAYAHQYRTRRADGNYYWLEANGRVDLAPDGTPVSFPGVLLDVDGRRAVEAERDRVTAMLRSLNETLEQRVTERTAELMRAEEALRQSQKMEAVGQLTGGLAHDFNNLLAGISGSLELMNARIAQGRLADVDKYLVAAQGATKRAAALTHRLLAFSRRQTLEPKATDVARLIGGMEDLVRRTVGPQVQIETASQAGLWPTLVDPNQLENALLNLCINARDAMPDGGRIMIEAANRTLDKASAAARDLAEGDYVSIAVSDTGVGIPPDILERVFEPFFTTKPIGLGTGLGLSMIFGFAKQSGGQVRVHSEVERGTSVTLLLPRHRGDLTTDEVGREALGNHRVETGETVLVIDDEPLVRMLVLDVLEELGYAALQADDGPTGLEIIRSDAKIDLLITDVGLPNGMNGRQVADAARVIRPNLKVLFVTGYAENAVLNHGHLDAGMEVITKPFDLAALAQRIRHIVSK